MTPGIYGPPDGSPDTITLDDALRKLSEPEYVSADKTWPCLFCDGEPDPVCDACNRTGDMYHSGTDYDGRTLTLAYFLIDAESKRNDVARALKAAHMDIDLLRSHLESARREIAKLQSTVRDGSSSMRKL